MKCSKHDNVKELAIKIEKELDIDVKCEINCYIMYVFLSI